MSFRTFQAYLDNIRLINLQLPIIYDAKDLSFTLESDDQVIPLTIQTCKSSTEHCLYSLTLEEDIDLEQHYLVYDQDRNKTVLAFRHIVQEPIFDQTFDYDQDDLGATYSSKATSFAFWAPISEQVLIKLKKDGKETVWPLLRQEKGVGRELATPISTRSMVSGWKYMILMLFPLKPILVLALLLIQRNYSIQLESSGPKHS